MTNNSYKSQMDAVYQHLWSAHGDGIFAVLDQSLHPRPPTMLYDILKQLGLNNNHKVLDVGCGRGNHSCELASRFGCSVIGLDPVTSNLEQGFATAAETGVADRVTFREGKITAIPFGDGTFHHIWCRDMFVHVDDLERGIRECARVLTPGGAMIVFTTFATELMEPKEMEYVCKPLKIVVENLAPRWVE